MAAPAPARDASIRPEDREQDRLAAIDARRTALVVVPVVGVAWVLFAVLGGEDALRIATLVALLLCVAVGVRATSTTQRFRRRWMDPETSIMPPAWITLVTVAAAIAAAVAGSNLAADVQADRSAVTAIVLTVVSLAVFGGGAFSISPAAAPWGGAPGMIT